MDYLEKAKRFLERLDAEKGKPTRGDEINEINEVSRPSGWWVVTEREGRIELVEPAPEPGEVLGEFTTRTIEIPHQEDLGSVDVWTVAEGDGVVRWWFAGRRKRTEGKDRGQ